MDCEDDRNLLTPGQVDHSNRDRIAAVGEHHIGLKDLQERPEKLQDGTNLLGALPDVPGGIQPHDRDRNVAPAGVEHPRSIRAANRGSDLIGLSQLADDLFEARLVRQVQLGRTERLGIEAERREPLEHIQGGHRGAVGEIDD